jgi:hypothetical protein
MPEERRIRKDIYGQKEVGFGKAIVPSQNPSRSAQTDNFTPIST